MPMYDDINAEGRKSWVHPMAQAAIRGSMGYFGNLKAFNDACGAIESALRDDPDADETVKLDRDGVLNLYNDLKVIPNLLMGQDNADDRHLRMAIRVERRISEIGQMPLFNLGG